VVRSPPVTSVMTVALVSKDEFENFVAVFPDIVKDLTDNSLKLNVPNVTEWLENVCENSRWLCFAAILLYYIF